MSGKLTEIEEALFQGKIRIAQTILGLTSGMGKVILIEELYQLFKKRYSIEAKEARLDNTEEHF